MHDLFARDATFNLPEMVSGSGHVAGNLIKRLSAAARTVPVKWSELPNDAGYKCTIKGGLSYAVVSRDTTSLQHTDAVLKVEDASTIESAQNCKGRWILPKPRRFAAMEPSEIAVTDATLASWEDAFQLRSERYEGGELLRSGLRAPQVGAIQAVLSHWSVSTRPGTVVLPTGTGKTETMLALLIMAQIPRLFVVVPSDALRTQIAGKFLSLGVLKQSGCLRDDALEPTVAVLKHAPKTKEDLEKLLFSSHVVVATMDVVNALAADLKQAIADWASHLFVDEAHHIAAKKWRSFKQHFGQRIVLQFTATPYRRDEKRVDGKHLYSYPLRKAQQEGYFRPITFVPVMGFSQGSIDDQIIEKVAAQLDNDWAAGHPHLAMARVRWIHDAEALHLKYQAKLGRYNPQIIHSKMKPSEREKAIQRMRSGEAKIIVCCDMLGEGFDLPELKVAALHDKHKSEAITLQFIGRFTRTRQDLGEATVIANVAMDDVQDRLKALYAQDADWNHLLNVVGAPKSYEARRREEIIDRLASPPEWFQVENLQPRMSTIVYQTDCEEWSPDDIEGALGNSTSIVDGPSVAAEERLLFVVTRDEAALAWTDMKYPRDVEYNLIMAFWDEERDLLFINTSRKKDLHEALAKKLAGPTAKRIEGETSFKVLHGFERLLLSNLGLSETQRKPVRYSMFMGSDIAEQLNAYAGTRTKKLNNLFGQGYIDKVDVDEEGEPLGTSRVRGNIGCSIKGKIWAHGTSNGPGRWMDWCRLLGEKLKDPAITTEGILRSLVKAVVQKVMPIGKVPLAIDWPEEFLIASEDKVTIRIGDLEIPFFECEIGLDAHTTEGGIIFHVGSEDASARFVLNIENERATFAQTSGEIVMFVKGKTEKQLTETFNEDPPHIYMADGDVLVGSSLLVVPKREDQFPFDIDLIRVGGWEGVDLSVESQGLERNPVSIQRRVIESIAEDPIGWDVIFDDDEAGEIADVVALKLTHENKLIIHLFHCKYVPGGKVRAQIHDLYEVCGQAQKSVRWAEQLGELLKHMQRREGKRRDAGKTSRFQRGDPSTLIGWINRWQQIRPEYRVTLVQPGYSKAGVQPSHLELLAATQSYLMDTYRIGLDAWFND
ncbi:DEAD/DEAH box helicase [Devosia sp. A369]